MSNKKGMFSWFSKKPEQKTEQQDQVELETTSAVSEDIKPQDGGIENEIDIALLSEKQVEIIAEALIEPDVTESSDVISSFTDEQKTEEELSFFARFVQRLTRTRLNFGNGLFSLFKGKKIDDDLFEELEEQLIIADIGVQTTSHIIESLIEHSDKKQLKNAELLYDLLKKDLTEILKNVEQPLVIDKSKKPYVILMVGVNGVGKTTTIGKLAKKFQREGQSVMLAAGDTFRAAAVEQLQVWGQRNNIPVIAQQTGADSASVLFDAMDAASARGIDVLIADTAGRLQNKDHLMTELAKVVRIMRKKDATAPHEIMLTIDAGTGQNAISQVKLFHEAVGLTGVTFTKLDGTAKGGIIFSIADQFKLPIRYIGVGEGIDDLREFNAQEFTNALFSKDHETEQNEKTK
jgi:fused signal recognition particle receptor